MPTTRRDYLAHITQLGLSIEEASPETILARSGGTRATDYIEVFAPPQWNADAGMVALRTRDCHMLGYMPAYLVPDMSVMITVEQVNPAPAPQYHRVLCRLQAQWPADRQLFTDDRFQPFTAGGCTC